MTAAPTRISTPFGEFSTADEVAEGIDLSGRRAVVTGASSGIGVETARTLASHGAQVTMAVRNTEAGEKVAADIRAGAPDARVEVRPLELGDRASVAAFVDGWSGPLDLLVNNAGVMALPSLELTADGLETQFATNHLGHFALTTGLHRALAAADGARVVSVSSAAHLRCPVLFDDLAFSFVPYDPFLAYGQSKTANVLLAVEATRRWADDGITANAVMPGGIATGLQRHVDMEALTRARREAGASDVLKTTEQGAATSVLLATSPLLEGVGGRYFEDCGEATVIGSRSESDGRHGVAAYALDPENAARLWTVSAALLGR
ncbi:SDR family NAD(P)-dependent oxidoreductase [Actinomycetospora endophytica]|uniref:SDR family NAD(P)-dependent oxidoreductase n=1 Tax=Actinomycetospora endophytica TaxID=2291215 RepID=A0ABS8P623_9PSEU|nr:SDR family NAD(P)-dependent oxidoreductase [Actinomycetospora endophytica]MCD2193709.1 SDR family NAD(P)-dependent oxidoreductase [Actinomycetospora endophytica]